MPIQEQNFWLTTAEMPKTDPALPLPGGVNVAIIGGGFTGLSAARTLAKLGAKVAVLEAETIGWGASSRNGGMVLTGLKLGVNKLISMYGRERTQRMYAASLATIDCVEKLVSEEKIDCDFLRSGHLEVACKQKHFDDYARQAEVIAREFNHQLRVVPRAELQSEIGSSIYYGGMVDEVSAGLESREIRGRTGAGSDQGRARLSSKIRGWRKLSVRTSMERSAGESPPLAALCGRARCSSAPAATPERRLRRCARSSFPLAPTSSPRKSCPRRWRAS